MSAPSIREHLEAIEIETLAPYAVASRTTRGRRYPGEEHPYRTAYQRDRDRVIHSRAFRRLEYKTQVFVNFEGDHYRNRLTHTLEATQIARTISRALRVNEDLTEAISLAHDLGHPPFGHAGQDALHELMARPEVVAQFTTPSDRGGFEHNRQSLRIVDWLEGKNPRYPGLNLTWEVREGIAKHRFVQSDPALAEFRISPHPSIEAQIANVADEIAYTCHDIDDALRAGLITPEQLAQSTLWQTAVDQVGQKHRPDDEPGRRFRAVEWLIDRLVTDVVDTTAKNLEAMRITSEHEARWAAYPVVAFSDDLGPLATELKRLLFHLVYNHYLVVRMKEKARRLLRDLFLAYHEAPQQLPPGVQRQLECVPTARVICDYVSGMTDRFAVEEHRRLYEFDLRVLP